MSVSSRTVDPPCNQDLVELTLATPLAGRRVVDAERGTELSVAPANFLYPDPATLVPAECTSEASVRAVAHDIDGGLQSNLLACDGTWMAVITWTNACPPESELSDEGCVGNEHVAYFTNVGGYWEIVAFDCDGARREEPAFPDSMCQG